MKLNSDSDSIIPKKQILNESFKELYPTHTNNLSELDTLGTHL